MTRDLGDLGYGCDDANPYDHCGSSGAAAINERGQIVGSATATSGLTRAAIWEPGSGVAQDLGFGTGNSAAIAINERGQIAGNGGDAGSTDGATVGFFRDADGTITSIGSLGGGVTRVVAMNNAGTITGWSRTGSGEMHAFVWGRATGMIDLGLGPFGAPGVAAVPVAINDGGDVTGYVVPCRTYNGRCYPDASGPVRAVLWRSTRSGSIAQR